MQRRFFFPLIRRPCFLASFHLFCLAHHFSLNLSPSDHHICYQSIFFSVSFCFSSHLLLHLSLSFPKSFRPFALYHTSIISWIFLPNFSHCNSSSCFTFIFLFILVTLHIRLNIFISTAHQFPYSAWLHVIN